MSGPAPTRSFFSTTARQGPLEQLGISEGTFVFCYTGNVHSANARDVRSLYLAAAILDREGIPAKLIRTGRDFCSFLGPDEEWAHRISIDLGHVEYQEIPALLSLADVLVQPGGDDAFNEFRLPGKLPEFFAMGRPVILPRSNVGRFVRHGVEAWVLNKVDALGIVNAVLELRADKALSARLAAGASEFCRQRFNWKRNAAAPARFYEEIALAPKDQADVPTTTAAK